MPCLGLVVAAGRSTRMASEIPKILLPLADKPVLVHTLLALESVEAIQSVCLVCRPEDQDRVARALSKEPRLRKVAILLPGGEERKDSVWQGLQWAREMGAWSVVCIHDGARPLVTRDLVARCVASARVHGSGVAAVRVADTIKRADPEGWVQTTLDRSGLWQVQTPQVFQFEPLYRAYSRHVSSNVAFVDDAILMEMEGHAVKLVEGTPENLKITWPQDLIVAETTLRRRMASPALEEI